MSALHPPTSAAQASVQLRDKVNAWLVSHCASAQGVLQGAVLIRGSQGVKMIACHPTGIPVPAWLAKSASAAVARRERMVVKRATEGGPTQHVTANPLVIEGMVVGAAVIVCDRAPGDAECAALDASAVTFSLQPGPAQASAARPGHSQHVLEMLHKVSVCKSLEDASALLSTRLAAELGCDRVSLGLRRRQQTRLIGSSDGWESEPSGLSADVCSAMDEAMDGGETVVYPPPPGRSNWLVAAHAHLSEKRETRAICTLPLIANGQALGALLAERRAGHPFLADEVSGLEMLARAIAPWVAQRQQLEMPWRERARQSLSTWAAAHDQGRHRLAAAAGVAALAALMLWPVDQEVSAPVKLEGSEQRIVTSPADNYLQKVLVRPGDVVKAGQLLLEFASEDLRVERQRLSAELAGNDAAVGDAMARQDMSTLALKMAKMNEDKAQLALLDQRLAKARVTAPFDAVVIQGDLSNALGAPTKKGDALMTLAPVGDFHAIVEVDDSDIAEIHLGQAGSMVLTALPNLTLPMSVKRITPLAAVAQGRSFFEVEVELAHAEGAPHELRPGMRGFARLETPRRALGSVWLQQAGRRLRLAWWRWVA